MPVTLGHEFSGTVEEVGDGIVDIKPGDRVVVEPIIYDETCDACQSGLINCCAQTGYIGLSGRGGGLSDHVVVPRKSVYRLPDNVPLDVGALVEPLAVAWHAVNISPFQPNDSTLVLGGGPIGLAVVQCLKARDAKNVIVSEISERRKQFARDFGADHVLDPTKDDIIAKCKELCGGQGPQVAFDAAGAQAGLMPAFLALRARGTLVNIALWGRAASFEPNPILVKEKRYYGSHTYVKGEFQGVLDAISSGKLKPEAMITRKIRLEDTEEEGIKALIHDKDNQVKILVEI
ncbi:MAG: hypothetical protein M1833_000954 [Piccolia ochrophora]|nr:MAG: hypothetical protein M1833_000954 [Piccolia ochrophora]